MRVIFKEDGKVYNFSDEEVENAVKRQLIAKKVVVLPSEDYDPLIMRDVECPLCGMKLRCIFAKPHGHCPRCGQLLDWEE